MTLQLSAAFGKLGGGAEVEVVPASASLSGSGTNQVLHTVNIAPGETWLVAVVGTGTSSSNSAAYMPKIIIGGKGVPQYAGYFASAAVMTESGDVVFESRSTSASSFNGNVYTVKM